MLSSSHSSYFHCALLPPPTCCAPCFEALIQHKLLYLVSEYMGTLIICEFHLKMPLEQERGEFRSFHGQTIHLWYCSSREIFSSVLYSLKHVSVFIHYTLTKPYILLRLSTVLHLFFLLLFTAKLSKCLHLSCSLYCPDLHPWTLCIMHRKAAVCPDNTGMVLGQEMNILMDHQTLTKMCNYLRSPHYAVPPPWWHQGLCFKHSLFFWSS